MNHSMTRANLNKSKKSLDFYYHSIKVHTQEAQDLHNNWNPPFQTQIYLVNVRLNVNIVKQDSLHKKQFLKSLWSEVWKGGFQLMLILVILGMYFDTVVVFVTSQTPLFRLALAILWCEYLVLIWGQLGRQVRFGTQISTLLFKNCQAKEKNKDHWGWKNIRRQNLCNSP